MIAQAAALNKQSNLNSFFDVTAGNGTYAPRNRKAFSSKRLQQVISDFRSKRKRDSASLTPVLTSDSRTDSASEEEVAPTYKRKKTVTKGKGKARTSTPGGSRRGRERGAPRGHGSSPRKSRATHSDNDDNVPTSSEDGSPEIPPDTVIASLRPRPKPRPAFKGAREAADEPQKPTTSSSTDT